MSNYPLWDQLNQLKESKWVDLTHTFDPDIPRFSDFEKGEADGSRDALELIAATAGAWLSA